MPAHHANQFKPRKRCALYQKQHDGRIEDEVGELGESERDFIRICTTALNSGRFAKYRTTKVSLQIVRQSPVLTQRLPSAILSFASDPLR